ncbi:hypothetical protein AB3329_01925 [Streptococcus sp. H31]|uniref:hypothetical protein n=1 Tax=Streptococcus huangxiaojuni TaxID=3237239 RepID=UPI0034A2270C
MATKEQLYIKLVIYSLGRSREFILSHYDEELVKAFTEKELENHSMMGFAFETLDPRGLTFEISDELSCVVDELVEAINNIETAVDLHRFAIKEIPIWVKSFKEFLKVNF